MSTMQSLRWLTLGLCVTVQGCTSKDDAAKAVEPADFAEQWAEAGCERLVECLEDVGKSKKEDEKEEKEDEFRADSSKNEKVLEECIDDATPDLKKKLKVCSEVDPELAEDCLKETKKAECDLKNLDKEVPACTKLIEACEESDEEADGSKKKKDAKSGKEKEEKEDEDDKKKEDEDGKKKEDEE